MRNRAGGILIEDGKILLMHRIKENDGVVDEYYVVPGGGMEGEETIEEATKRELIEEMGISVELLEAEPLLTLEDKRGIQYFSLVKKISGEIGTGVGPEFTDKSYADHGFYGVELIPLQDIVSGQVNMVPVKIKEEFVRIITSLDKPLESISSSDLISKEKVLVKE